MGSSVLRLQCPNVPRLEGSMARGLQCSRVRRTGITKNKPRALIQDAQPLTVVLGCGTGDSVTSDTTEKCRDTSDR